MTHEATARAQQTGRIAEPADGLRAVEARQASAGLRLLVVSSDTYPPQRVDVAVLFGDELDRRGHRIDWILQSDAPCDRSYVTTWKGRRVFVGATDLGTSLWHRVHKHVRGIANDFRLLRILRAADHDAVEVKDKFIAGLFAVAAKRLYGVRLIYWLSFPYPEEYLIRARDGTARYPLLYWWRGQVFRILLYKVLLPAADHIFVQSEQMREDVAAKGIATQRMTAVPMGIDPEEYPAATAPQRRSHIPPGVPALVYLGALDRTRRLEFMFDVLGRLRCTVPDARLYLVGRSVDPADERWLQGEAARLHLAEAVVFVGQLPRAQAFEYVREADVCVSPLYPTPMFRVASPTKLVEYLALGKAVVVNDHPEQRQVVEESGAGLCVPWDARQFAEAAALLLLDPARVRAMGERGRRYVLERRTYTAIADSVERGMRQALSSRGAHS